MSKEKSADCDKKKQRKSKAGGNGPGQVLPPPQKQKEWKMDALRNQDRLQISSISQQLRKCRKQVVTDSRHNPPTNSNVSTIANRSQVKSGNKSRPCMPRC
jgi:hypothetical protein